MGLMLAEPDFHTRCYVEWGKKPRECLIGAMDAGYFEPAPIWDDVTTFDGKPFRRAIDTILAGYPCQGESVAGKRLGKDDERWLWPDIARIIREVQPAWVILENVSGHITLGAETVLRELREMGFNVAVGLFTAAETGATHKRERWFCVGYSVANATQAISQRSWWEPARCAGFTNDCEELAHTISHAGHQGRHRESGGTNSQGEANSAGPYSTHLFPPGPAESDAWAEIIRVAPNLAPATSFGDAVSYSVHLAQMVAAGGLAEAEAERAVRRMVDGLAGRSRALKLLGNGVVPLEAAYAIRTLLNAHGLGSVYVGAARDRIGNETREFV